MVLDCDVRMESSGLDEGKVKERRMMRWMLDGDDRREAFLAGAEVGFIDLECLGTLPSCSLAEACMFLVCIWYQRVSLPRIVKHENAKGGPTPYRRASEHQTKQCSDDRVSGSRSLAVESGCASARCDWAWGLC